MLIQDWIMCKHPVSKFGAPFGSRVTASTCLQCDIICPEQCKVVEQLLQKDLTLDELKDKGRIITVKNMYYCPLKSGKECHANRRYCKYNHVCPNVRFPGRFKGLRWRKVMKYGIKNRNEEVIRLCEKEDIDKLTEEELKVVEKVYKVTYALTTVIELVPHTEEGEDVKASLKILTDRFSNKILGSNGKLIKLKDWHNSAEVGDVCFAFSDELITKKVIKPVAINKYVEDKGLLPPKKESAPSNKVSKKQEAPVKQEGFTPGIPDSTEEAPYGYKDDGTPRQRRPRRSKEELEQQGIKSRGK